MMGTVFMFAGVEMQACSDGALFVPAWSTLVVADMHLEKGSEFAGRGALLPPYDSRATLGTLARCIDGLNPTHVICLGDSFHDGDGPQRMSSDDHSRLRTLAEGRNWIWVAGNHDPLATGFVGGSISAETRIGPIVFRHEAQADMAQFEVSGHFHPKASVRVQGRRVSGRCFVMDDRRLILPSFGAYTGGLDVFHPALRELMDPVFYVHLVGRDRVHTISSASLYTGKPNLSENRSA